MKMRRLSEIDLARIGPLPTDEKRRRLRLLKSRRPPHTYNPLRGSIGDILNLQPELFDDVEYTSWSQITADIAKRSTSEAECEYNLAVGLALYEFGVEQRAKSYRKPIAAWPVGYGQSVTYWWNLYTVLGDDACFIFVDPRLSNPLTQLARKFVLSIMHERIRVPDPDFSEAKLLVAQFKKAEGGKRALHLFDGVGSDLFSSDDLNQMVEETYRIWMEVLAERVEEDRRKASGSTPFGF